MQSPGGVDNHHVGTLSLCRRNGVEGNRCRVGTHLLLHHGHINAFAPNLQLLDGGSAEGVGSTQHNLVAGALKLIGKLSDGGGFAHAVHPHNHNYVGLCDALRHLKVVGGGAGCLGEHLRDFVAQQSVQFSRIYVFVARNTGTNAVDDFQSGVHTDVRGDERLLKLVEQIVVDGRFACYGACYFTEETLLGLFETFVEGLFLFLRKNAEQSHKLIVLNALNYAKILKNAILAKCPA